jgi:LDH2 family malate/lactate/ureidoglycolate dehydrogenase
MKHAFRIGTQSNLKAGNGIYFLVLQHAGNLYPYDVLYRFAKSVFEKNNVRQAAEATKALLAADLRGVDSHGIARLSGYMRLIEAGRINPQAAPAHHSHKHHLQLL